VGQLLPNRVGGKISPKKEKNRRTNAVAQQPGVDSDESEEDGEYEDLN